MKQAIVTSDHSTTKYMNEHIVQWILINESSVNQYSYYTSLQPQFLIIFFDNFYTNN